MGDTIRVSEVQRSSAPGPITQLESTQLQGVHDVYVPSTYFLIILHGFACLLLCMQKGRARQCKSSLSHCKGM